MHSTHACWSGHKTYRFRGAYARASRQRGCWRQQHQGRVPLGLELVGRRCSLHAAGTRSRRRRVRRRVRQHEQPCNGAAGVSSTQSWPPLGALMQHARCWVIRRTPAPLLGSARAAAPRACSHSNTRPNCLPVGVVLRHSAMACIPLKHNAGRQMATSLGCCAGCLRRHRRPGHVAAAAAAAAAAGGA